MGAKKTYDRIFARGWSRLLKERYGLNTSQLLRIARSGGVGLHPELTKVYAFLWKNRLDVFRPEYIDTFEANDKRH